MSEDMLGPIPRKWFRLIANAVVGLAMVGSIVLVSLISSRNAQLQREVARRAGVDSAARTLEGTLRRNIQLSALAGMPLPEVLARQVRAELAATGGHARGLLLMAYTPMVCERTLSEGLQSLNTYRSSRDQSVPLYAVVGERRPRDRERALLLRADGLLAFPLTFLSADSLIGALFPGADSTFDEEPIYLRLDERLTIRAAFHADQRRPALLDAWLGTIQ